MSNLKIKLNTYELESNFELYIDRDIGLFTVDGHLKTGTLILQNEKPAIRNAYGNIEIINFREVSNAVFDKTVMSKLSKIRRRSITGTEEEIDEKIKKQILYQETLWFNGDVWGIRDGNTEDNLSKTSKIRITTTIHKPGNVIRTNKTIRD